MNTRVIALLAVITLAVAGVYTALSSGLPAQQADQATPQSKQIKVKLTEADNESKIWVPSIIYVKRGERYEFIILNGDDDDEHGFSIPGLGIETKRIPAANGQETLLFTARDTGSFAFIDPTTPEWGTTACATEADEPPCIPPGQIVVQP